MTSFFEGEGEGKLRARAAEVGEAAALRGWRWRWGLPSPETRGSEAVEEAEVGGASSVEAVEAWRP